MWIVGPDRYTLVNTPESTRHLTKLLPSRRHSMIIIFANDLKALFCFLHFHEKNGGSCKHACPSGGTSCSWVANLICIASLSPLEQIDVLNLSLSRGIGTLYNNLEHFLSPWIWLDNSRLAKKSWASSI
eukprot:TRINITY_DN10073_c0_g1_i2.p1 TRINITY_DN10073_c0_g1~~TRINITY_DN10073_c0_g1_i2.p1  ORF type:complete len:129 (-),score=1.28 TRINITY_DN10073_c0_g1_i2:1590-1976(-)